MSSIFSDQNTIKLAIIYKKIKTLKITNMWRLNDVVHKNQLITKQIKEEKKKKPRDNETKTQHSKSCAKTFLIWNFIEIHSYFRKQ